MSKPTYEEFIGGKKLTATQHKRKMQQYKELYEKEEVIKEDGTPKERPGICPKCGSGSFGLKIKNHEFIRTCNGCEQQKVV